MEIIKSHRELRVYQKSFEVAMEIFKLTKSFPKEELYSLTDQIRRSSRSVSSNIAEAFRRRKYPKSFGSKQRRCLEIIFSFCNGLFFDIHRCIFCL